MLRKSPENTFLEMIISILGNTTGSLFGNKTSGFGLGNTGLSTGTGFTSGLGTGTTTGLFGNTQSKPAGFNFNTGSTGGK